MKCPSCGADISGESRRCEYCGSSITGIAVHASLAKPLSGDAETFARIKQSPEFALRSAVDRLAMLPKPGLIGLAIPLVFICVFVAASGFMAISALSFGAGFFAIVPLGFVVIGVLMFVGVLKQTKRFQSSPSIGRPAIIRAKRTEVSGGSGDSSASTTYYLTAEFEDGRREEFKAEDSLYGRVAEQDAGMLYTRTEIAQDFDRVRE